MHQSLSTLPMDVQDILRDLTSKDPASLTDEQLNFLRARSPYLTSDQLVKFGITAAPNTSEPAETTEDPPPPPVPARRSRKAA